MSNGSSVGGLGQYSKEKSCYFLRHRGEDKENFEVEWIQSSFVVDFICKRSQVAERCWIAEGHSLQRGETFKFVLRVVLQHWGAHLTLNSKPKGNGIILSSQ